ncbi:MAG TPA: hypothetical protein PKD55_22865 [Bellilinea sp.]|nr:hypothetical protein [Bellilinea sp.]
MSSVIYSNMAPLKYAFEHASRIAIHEAHKRSINSVEEPDFVAMFVLESVPYIASALRNVAASVGLSTTVSSIYCHQKPTVEYSGGKKGCELGDVLLVHFHKDKNGWNSYRNSLLLQAKMFSGAKYRIPYQEQHQLELYMGWPRFRYTRSGASLNGQTRDVRPKSAHPGAQYLLIDKGSPYNPSTGALGFPHTHCMAVWPASEILYPMYSLADELIRFLMGASGRTFLDINKKGNDGWSQMVWDLINHSLTFVFSRTNASINSASRFGGDQLVSSLTGMNFYIDDCNDLHISSSRDIANRINIQHKRIRNDYRRSDNSSNTSDCEDIGDGSLDGLGSVSLVLIETHGELDMWNDGVIPGTESILS